MTTIKKLNDKAAKAVCAAQKAWDNLNEHFISSSAFEKYKFEKYKEKAFSVTGHSETILKALQEQSELIRVIELSEEALSKIKMIAEKNYTDPKLRSNGARTIDRIIKETEKALSEIRKLKGE